MKKCPFCRIEILDDSFFCDQCGKELKICLDCHSFVAGKFCTNCSSRNIVMAKDFVTESEPTEQHCHATSLQVSVNATDQKQIPINKTIPIKKQTKERYTLTGINHEVKMELHTSIGHYLFGRNVGEFSDFFNSIRFISRKHAELSFDHTRAQWMLTDLSSSNGTFVNGSRLQPNMPTDIMEGDEIQIAFARFKFE